MLNVGDKIRILEDWHKMARVYAGDVLEVLEFDGDGFFTEAPRLTHFTDTWSFSLEDEGSGWEKVS